jgi:aspartate racemase
LRDSQNLLSLIDTTVDHIVEQHYSCIGLIASPTTIRSGLYADRLKVNGVDVKIPNSQQIREIEIAIRLVIAGRVESATVIVQRVINQLISNGCNVVLLGCTELSVASGTSAHIIDPLDLVVTRLFGSKL